MDPRGVKQCTTSSVWTTYDTRSVCRVARERIRTVISLDEAQRFVRDRISPLEPQDWEIEKCSGCVVAAPVVASEAIPGFTNSSMDGFALRSEDTASGSARLLITGAIHAGEVVARPLEAGEAIRIMTGAPLPDGADSVLMIEEAHVEGDHVVIPRLVRAGEFVRHVGGDVTVGQVLFAPGDELNAASVGVLAGQGRLSVTVHPRPRVGVLSTGDELARGDGPLGAGQIRDVNRPMLLSLLRDSGFTPVDLGIASDSRDAITEALRRGAKNCDAVITTGGVSVGDVDFVRHVIGDLGGVDARWMQVAIKPGKPFAFGLVGDRGTPIFGLPGNPVSTRVSFEMFVRPALRTMAGHRTVERLTLEATLDVALERPVDGKVHLVHVSVGLRRDRGLHVTDAMRFGSHLLNAVTGANAIAVITPDTACDIGDTVRVIVLQAESIEAS